VISTAQRSDRDARGRFLPGNPGGPGRPRGSRNRITVLLDAFARAVDQDGGEAFIVEFARRHPVRFQRIVAQVVPGSIAVTAGGTERAVD